MLSLLEVLLQQIILNRTMMKKSLSLFLHIFKHLPGKGLSFEFYPKAVYFKCKFWISRSAIARVQKWPIGPLRVASRETEVISSIV